MSIQVSKSCEFPQNAAPWLSFEKNLQKTISRHVVKHKQPKATLVRCVYSLSSIVVVSFFFTCWVLPTACSYYRCVSAHNSLLRRRLSVQKPVHATGNAAVEMFYAQFFGYLSIAWFSGLFLNGLFLWLRFSRKGFFCVSFSNIKSSANIHRILATIGRCNCQLICKALLKIG